MADYCREVSCSVEEPLHGTANDAVSTWVLVEHDGRWGPKVPAQAEGISEALRAWLGRVGELLPGARLQLVRRPGGCGPRPRLMVVHATETRQEARVREVNHIEELPGLDLAAVADGSDPASTRFDGPVYLVCTHGTRDRCCAKWGMPVYQALVERCPEHVWQCSHLGGHRFAATLAVLPQGFVYGRVSPDEVPALVEAVAAGELYDLDRIRGRDVLVDGELADTLTEATATCASPCCVDTGASGDREEPVARGPVGAKSGERRDRPTVGLLRQVLGERRTQALRFESLAPAEGGFVARFHHAEGGLRFARVRRRAELKVLGSCGDESSKTFRPFELVEHGSL